MVFNEDDLTSENTPMRWRIQGERVAGTSEEALLDDNYKAVLTKAATFTSDEEMGEGNQPGGGGQEPDPILVSSVSITGETEVAIAASITLVATVAPTNADNTAVVWTTSDVGIASNVAGVITGVAEGTVTITATAADDNGAKDTFDILVVA